MPWVPFAALRALWRGPFWTVQEHNSLKQAELPARFGDLLCNLLFDEHLNLAPFPVGASPFTMSPITASLASSPLRLGAILPNVSMLLTIEALNLAASLIHEDRHFCWSSTSWFEGYEVGGIVAVRDDGCTEYALHLHLEGII